MFYHLTLRWPDADDNSCGTVQTPQLLMLSGIGPASHLAQHNIPIVLDAPGVGANLADHVAVRLCFPEKMGVSLAYLQRRDLRSRMKRYRDLLEYLVWKSGPLASNVGRTILFRKQKLTDSSWGKGRHSVGLTIPSSSLVQSIHESSRTAPLDQVPLTWSSSSPPS